MDTLDTFDGSNPNLVSSKTLKDIETKLNVPNNNDNSNRMINGIGAFYNEYIAPNLFPLIVISLLIIYLTIKYVLKRDREEKEDREDEQNIKRERTKKHMLKIDPDDVINKMEDDVINKIEQELPTNISDMISDDYLLTDDDIDNKEMDNAVVRRAIEQGSPYDIDRATNIIAQQ